MNKITVHFRTWIYVFMGNMLYALALGLFLTANKIAAGGLAGIAVVLSDLIPLGVGVMTLIMNIPILICAGFMNGWDKLKRGTGSGTAADANPWERSDGVGWKWNVLR